MACTGHYECGVAGSDFGIVVWKEHPTLRAWMKMVASAWHVDSDQRMREYMKEKREQAASDEISPFSFTLSTSDDV
jgi:hypothetical protein